MNRKPEFQTVPDTAKIEGLNRNLRFHPVVNSRPTCLAPDQIASYNRDGFLKSIRVFDVAETTTIRDYFDDLLARVLAAGGDKYNSVVSVLRAGLCNTLVITQQLGYQLLRRTIN